MLQILSGKFFNETISVKEFNGKEIFYSNIMMFGKIETDLWTLENVNLNQGVSSYLLTLRGHDLDSTSQFFHPEAFNEFRLLTSFWFKSIFEYDKNNVEMLCRQIPQNPNDNQIPSKILPEYFSLQKASDDFENYKNFINKVLKLSREKYKAILNSIDLFFQALNALNYNLEFAFSLMVFSIESLCQKFDDFEENWEDYDDNVKSELNNLVEIYNISDEDYDNLKEVLLKNDHQKATKRFIDFSMSYVSDDFFREDAINSKTPLKKSDLKHVLKNCYRIRSSYVHNLEKIKKVNYIVSMMGNKETLGNESDLFLTFTGLTRLVHHILKNFIFSCEETGFEEIDFVEEIPHLANFPLAPQYWITDERGGRPEDIFIYYHYFLTLLIQSYNKEEFLEFKGLMHKIEENLKKGIKKNFKDATLVFYYLCNKLYDENGISEKFNQTCEKYDINSVLDNLSIETLICKLILTEDIYWDLEEIIDCYNNYVKNKFRKNALNLNDFHENCIVIVICNAFYHDENYKEFSKWANKLILELPSKVKCQDYIQNCINENKDIEFEEFNELYFNSNENE